MRDLIPKRSRNVQLWAKHTRQATKLNAELWAFVHRGEAPPEPLCVAFEAEVYAVEMLRAAGAATEAAQWCKEIGLETLDGFVGEKCADALLAPEETLDLLRRINEEESKKDEF